MRKRKFNTIISFSFLAMFLFIFAGCSGSNGPQTITFNLTATAEFPGESGAISNPGEFQKLSRTLEPCAFTVEGTVTLGDGTMAAQTTVPFIPANGCGEFGPEAGNSVVVFDKKALSVILDDGEVVEVCIQAVDLTEGILESVRSFSACQTFIPRSGEDKSLTAVLVESELRPLELACANVLSYSPFLFQAICGFEGNFQTFNKTQETSEGGGLEAAICEVGQDDFVAFLLDLATCPRCGNEIFDDVTVFGDRIPEQCEYGAGQDLCEPGRVCDSECLCACDVGEFKDAEDSECVGVQDAINNSSLAPNFNCGDDLNLCCQMFVALIFTEDDEVQLGPLNDKIFCNSAGCCENSDTCGNGAVDFDLGEECDPDDQIGNSLCEEPFANCIPSPLEGACTCAETLCNFDGNCDPGEGPNCYPCTPPPTR